LLTFAVVAGAQQAPQKKDTKPPAAVQEQEPPEEDVSLVPKEYSFNPLQASKDLRIGNYYFKKGNYRAAAHRFEEATKWDGTNAEAYLRLGEAQEKQRDRKAAAEAYAKYLEIAPDAKDAPEVKKRLEKVHK
jgi:Predicted methyltransferase (contains TPR repeat)